MTAKTDVLKNWQMALYGDRSTLSHNSTILSMCTCVDVYMYTFAICLGEELNPGNFGLLWKRLQVVPGFRVDYTV